MRTNTVLAVRLAAIERQSQVHQLTEMLWLVLRQPDENIGGKFVDEAAGLL
jgi:hypothetical protein